MTSPRKIFNKLRTKGVVRFSSGRGTWPGGVQSPSPGWYRFVNGVCGYGYKFLGATRKDAIQTLATLRNVR